MRGVQLPSLPSLGHVPGLGTFAARALAESHAAAVLARAGVLGPMRPDRALLAAAAVLVWGPTLAGGYAACAARAPGRPAVIDDEGALTFGDLDARATRLAAALRARGLGEGARVALLCRNSRHPVEALVGLSKAGADVLLLNTGASAAQVRDVLARERAGAVVVDRDLAELLVEVPADVLRITAHGGGDLTLADLVAQGSPDRLRPPERRGRVIVLTSGTTGTPKGAVRSEPASLATAGALLSRIPLRAGRTTMIAAPLFHTWGYANLQMAMALASTVVLSRRFEPAGVVRALDVHHVDALVAVPVMLSRLLDAGVTPPADARLRIVAVSGSALPGPLASRFMDAYGDVLYNLYGSTEVSWATIATPAELRSAPGTAGRPPRGTVLALLDEAGQPVPAGEVGRVFVGNELLFEGYTGEAAGTPGTERVGGLLATGDVGRLDADGLLHLSGRDDDMVVSGGENVFPREVEDLLAGEPEIAEVAVIGVADGEYGQRLAAYVVLRPGAALTSDEVRARVKGRLARFSVPRDVVFLAELPRNATGKVVPRELPPVA